MTVSEDTKDRVILKYLCNYPISQISSEEHISEATVHNIVTEFCSQEGNGSKKDKKQAKLLLEAMRRSNMKVPQHALAVKLYNKLGGFVSANEEPERELTVEELDGAVDILEKLLKVCRRGLVNPIEAIKANEELQAMSNSLGVKPADLVVHVRELHDEARSTAAAVLDARSKKEEAEREAEAAKRQRDEELARNDITFQELESYKKLKAVIRERTGDKDPSKYIPNVMVFIAKAQKEGEDPQEAIPLLKDMAEMKRDHEKRQEQFKKENQMMERLCQSHERYLRAQGDRVEFVRTAEEQGIGPKECKILLNTIAEIAKRQGMSPSLVIDNLSKAMEQHLSTTEFKKKEPNTTIITTDIPTTTTTTISPPPFPIPRHEPGSKEAPSGTLASAAPVTPAADPRIIEMENRVNEAMGRKKAAAGAEAEIAAAHPSLAPPPTTTIAIDTGQLEPDKRPTIQVIEPTDDPYSIYQQPVIREAVNVKVGTGKVMGSGYCSTSDVS